jgi:6-phosphogluconolactonase/glucosamine-6-phosphate isomerase/deaminase
VEKIFFIVNCGKNKGIVNEILNDPKTAKNRYPAAMVQPKEELVWFFTARRPGS